MGRPSPRRQLRFAAFAVSLAAVLLPPLLPAQERLVRQFGTREGLTSTTVFSLAQDSSGFLWIGTASGLYRYDGVEIRRWAPESLGGRIKSVTALADGRMAALEEEGSLWWVTGGEADRAREPATAEAAPRDVVEIATGRDGALWVLREGGRLWRRGETNEEAREVAHEEAGEESDAGTRWRELDLAEAIVEEDPRRIVARREGGVWLLTTESVWAVPRRGTPERRARMNRAVDVLSLPGGRTYVLAFNGELDVLRDGRRRRLLDIEGRGIDLAVRDGTLWATYDRYLVRLPPGGPPEVVGPGEGMESGGPLLVDAEGSLWMGSLAGLLQFPEPETVTWSDEHGLPSAHTRFVEKAGDAVWIGTWQGVGRVLDTGTGWDADTLDALFSRADVVTDDEGDLWAGTPSGLTELRPGRTPIVHEPGVTSLITVAEGRTGVLWMGTEDGVYRVESAGYGGGSERAVRRLPGLDIPADVPVSAILHDRDGRLWTAFGERICRAPADSVRTGDAHWICDTVPGAGHFNALYETPSGSVWAASPYASIVRHREGRWEELPEVSELPSRSVLNLVPSSAGGVWVLGHGILHRIVPAPESARGWRIAERLSAWHGLPTSGGRDLVEEADGTLWITTSRGLVRIPGDVREETLPAPRVELVEARVDDERLPRERFVELPHRRNRLELRFAALSFRAPSRVRYQVRLLPGSEWSETRFQPVVRWVDLRPGTYGAEARASLDGTTWSPAVGLFRFEVLPPWYLKPRWMMVLLLTLMLAALLLYRTRVNHLLELERQRTRIAMDLHDELGAALGSIGIQAGMLRRPDVAAPQRRRLAEVIGETAEEVGTKLTDMVWSLDPRTATLERLALRLEERGRRLFAGRGAEFVVDLPRSWPAGELRAAVRRNVLLVGLEAIRNAAAHAGADRVVLALAPVRHGRWRLTVADDGRGIRDAGIENADGLGLRSMRERAREIDAEIEWSDGPDHPERAGTTVTLVFRLRGRVPLGNRIRQGVARLGAWARHRMNMLLRRR